MISMLLLIIRAMIGPSFFDRILAVNSFGTTTVALIAILGVFFSDQSMLDVAIIYALVNFITTIAFLKFFHHKTLKS